MVCSAAAALRWARVSGGGVGELQGEVVERFSGSVWTKEGLRWKLRGGLGRGGANGGSGRRKAWLGAWSRDGE